MESASHVSIPSLQSLGSQEDSSNTCHSLILNLDMKLIVSNGFSSATESNY